MFTVPLKDLRRTKLIKLEVVYYAFLWGNTATMCVFVLDACESQWNWDRSETENSKMFVEPQSV